MTITWTVAGALALVVCAAALVAGLALLFRQLQARERDVFVVTTGATFAIWMDDDFQKAQQWILYELKEETWKGFVAAHRGDYGERAFIRVGSFYNRVGYLVTANLLGSDDKIVLDTIAGVAIAVWQKIGTLALEARLIENSTLFQDFERMLPRCYECYVPTQPIPPGIAAGAHEVSRAVRLQGE